MKTTRRGMSWACLGLTSLLWGCGTGKTLPETKSVATGVAPASQSSGDAKPDANEKTAPVQKVDEDSALAAVKQTLGAIERGDLTGAYEFLPPGYQSDVDGLVHEFAAKMDGWVARLDIRNSS